MKAKWIFGIVAVIMILSIFSISRGADKFYYGAYNWIDITKDFQYIRDSLRCNILWGDCRETDIDSFKNHSLRAIVNNSYDPYSPANWARQSHYTLWEAEGLDGSWVNLEHASWGQEVNDPYASGGKAMRFGGLDTATIQWGPTYYQERGPEAEPIQYTAEFCLKYLLGTPLGPMAPGPPPTAKVCSLMVVDRDATILKDTTLYKSDFSGFGNYETFKLVNYTVPSSNKIEFKIYWFGNLGTLYIDYVKVYDDFGDQLVSGLRDSAIMDYVSQPWVNTTIAETGDAVVHRWYLRDEPPSIDLFATNRYVDNLLREVSTERVGFQAIGRVLKSHQAY